MVSKTDLAQAAEPLADAFNSVTVPPPVAELAATSPGAGVPPPVKKAAKKSKQPMFHDEVGTLCAAPL